MNHLTGLAGPAVLALDAELSNLAGESLFNSTHQPSFALPTCITELSMLSLLAEQGCACRGIRLPTCRPSGRG